MSNSARPQSGQALLIILLAMTVVVTLGLSVVSRSISDVSITTEQEDALRAFSAAEAGIEEIIVSSVPIGSTTSRAVSNAGDPNEIAYSATVKRFPENASEFVYPVEIGSGDSATVWLKEHDANGNPTGASYNRAAINILWGKPDSSLRQTAIEISVFYIESSNGRLQVARQVVDPRRQIDTNAPDATMPSAQARLSDGTQYRYYEQLVFSSDLGANPVVDQLVSMDVRFIYNRDSNQPLAVTTVTPTHFLPSQGTYIESVGTSGDATRKVLVSQLYPHVPSIFNSAISSKTDIVK